MGYVYVVGTYNTAPPMFKIGKAGSIKSRMASIRTANPFPLCGVYIRHDNPAQLEKRLHREMDEHRQVGEWFVWTQATDQRLTSAVKAAMGWEYPTRELMGKATIHQQIELEAVEDYTDLLGGELPPRYRPPMLMMNADLRERMRYQVVGFDVAAAETSLCEVLARQGQGE